MKTLTKIAYSWGETDSPAVVFGEWAAHESTDHHGGWRVTHAPTGFGTWTLADEMDPIDAIEIARMLNDRVPTLKLVPCASSDANMAPCMMSPDDAHIVIATFAEVLGA